jgi:hypothetical protein
MRIEPASAQALFDALPASMQVPTLSPAYVMADALRDASLEPVFVAWRRGDALLMHAMHESAVPGDDAVDWQSPYGYGGPIARDAKGAALADAWRECDEVAHERGVVAEFVRFHPLASNHHHYPGPVREDRQVVCVDLRTANLLSSYSGRARTAIRKAGNAGLQVRWESAAEAAARFPGFYREGMRQIGANDFYLFNDAYFAALLALRGAKVLSVMREDQRLSMGLFLFGATVVEYHLSATTPAGRDGGATNLLLHAAAARAQEEGRTVLYLGGGTDARFDNPLLRFKASFATPSLRFCTGHRIHATAAYARLRARFPDLARSSGRVLFYRG